MPIFIFRGKLFNFFGQNIPLGQLLSGQINSHFLLAGLQQHSKNNQKRATLLQNLIGHQIGRFFIKTPGHPAFASERWIASVLSLSFF